MPKLAIDSSAYASPLPIFTGTATLDTSIKKFGAASFLLDGSSSCSIYVPSSARFALPGDLTVECWAYWPSAPSGNSGVFSFGIGATIEVYRTPTSKLVLYANSAPRVTGTTTVTDAVWHHVAVTRSGSTMTLWLDGVSQGTYTYSTSLPASYIAIGAYQQSSDWMAGNVDEFRATAGVARYTAGFTPATSAFPDSAAGDSYWDSVVCLLHADSYFDQSSAPTKIVGAGSRIASVTMASVSVKPKTEDAIKLKDAYWGGLGVISGTVKEKNLPSNTPVVRRVRLFDQRSSLLVAETWSTPGTGAYSFENLDASLKYTVIAYDHTGLYGAVIADGLTPTAIP